jgi:hypothetical protein
MTCPRGCCPDYRTHINNISIGSFPTPITEKERKWDKDMRAYKSLRRDGLQPKKIDGSHVVERTAKNEREVTMGRPLPPLAHKVFDDAGI